MSGKTQVLSARRESQARKLAISALLCALNVVFARFFTVMPTAIARLSIEAVPIVLAGYFFGPVTGMLVGFTGDTVGCLFSAFGWDPIFCVSPMLVGLFAGLLRPLTYTARSMKDIWRVALTILPAKLLGSVYWTSQCLVWLGFTSKGLGALMGVRAAEAGIELVLDTLVVTLLLASGLPRRLALFPPAQQKRPAPERIAGWLAMLEIVLLTVGSLTVGLRFADASYGIGARIGWALVYFAPLLAAAALYLLSLLRNKKTQKKAIA